MKASREICVIESEIDAMVTSGDESRDTPGAAAPVPEAIPSATEIQRLVSGLAVQRTANGGLVIVAPPETAAMLAALFSTMAQLLQATAAPPNLSQPRADATELRRAVGPGGRDEGEDLTTPGRLA